MVAFEVEDGHKSCWGLPKVSVNPFPQFLWHLNCILTKKWQLEFKFPAAILIILNARAWMNIETVLKSDAILLLPLQLADLLLVQIKSCLNTYKVKRFGIFFLKVQSRVSWEHDSLFTKSPYHRRNIYIRYVTQSSDPASSTTLPFSSLLRIILYWSSQRKW